MNGYVFGLISSLFFAIYIVPRKLTKINPIYFSVFMASGFFISSFFLYLLQPYLGFNEKLDIKLLWGIPAGIIWAISFVAFIKSIDLIGLSRSSQWKNLQGPIGIVLGLIVLNEQSHTNALFAILAGVAIFISAIFFSATNNKNKSKLNLHGISLGVFSGVGFGIVSVLNKYITTNVGVYSQQVVWSFAIALSLTIYTYLNKNLRKNLKNINLKDINLGLLSGLIYLGASFFMLQSYLYLPISVGLTIIQLSIVWIIIIGVFVFKEIDIYKYWRKIMFGFLFAILGVLFLFFTKN